jgi:hypothetical protein
MVKLTAAGEAQAGEGGELRVSNRHLHYLFRPGAPVEVVRAYEWEKVLRRELTHSGLPLFELAEEDAVEVETKSEDEVSADGSV